jgi:hypothetical protein
MMAKRKAAPKRKSVKRKPREIVPEPLNPFLEYGGSLPRSLTFEIRSKIDDGNSDLEELVNALHALDQIGNKKPLVELLKSRGTTPTESVLLADLIDRHILPKRGRRRDPIYVLKEDHHTMLNALARVGELRAGGMSLDEAVTKSAQEHGIPHSRLVEWRAGRSRWQRNNRKSARK